MSFKTSFRKIFFSVSDDNALFKNRGFYFDANTPVTHLEEVGRKFLFGYHGALYSKSQKEISDSINNSVSDLYKGFCFEGAAMAFALLDAMSIFNKKRLPNFILNQGCNHIYMLHVGAGWAFARLPFNVEKQIAQFDPLLRWLIIDGYGFHQAYFKTKTYVSEKKEPAGLSDFAKHVFYQGVGRCLWFVEGTNPERISETIKSFPDKYFADLWAGVGLSCAYAGGGDQNKIETVKRLSGTYLNHLKQGVAFAAGARQLAGNMVEHTQIACKIICGMTAEEASGITEQSRKEIISNASAEKYAEWRRLIREKLSSEKILNPH